MRSKQGEFIALIFPPKCECLIIQLSGGQENSDGMNILEHKQKKTHLWNKIIQLQVFLKSSSYKSTIDWEC